ncbi:hypothetical protein STEG23_005671 [Scotinomys teguina]
MCQLSWFLDPGGWGKAAVVGRYFIFPGICTLSLISLVIETMAETKEWTFFHLSCEEQSLNGKAVPGIWVDVYGFPVYCVKGGKVGRTVCIGSTCFLSVFQVITISPMGSTWSKCKLQAPRFIPTYFEYCETMTNGIIRWVELWKM